MTFSRAFNSGGKPFPIPLQPPSGDFDPDSIAWWHSITLPDGGITKGGKSLEIMQAEATKMFGAIDLTGKTFLDVGAWNGGLTMEAFRRGASRLVALDRYHLPELEHYFHALKSINYVIDQWNMPVELFTTNLDHPRLDLSALGQFDVVLFSGVFYHLLNPLTALREVAMLAKDLLIVETYIDNTIDDRPGMIFYPRNEVNNDSSNWWGPNIPFLTTFLEVLGFTRIAVTHSPGEDRGILHAYRDVKDQYFRPDIATLDVALDR